MNVSCPSHGIEDMEAALKPFDTTSFLTPIIKRTSDGLLSKRQFDTLLDNAYKNGYLKYNAYSFYQMASNVNREYCYYLERFVFFNKLYAHTKKLEHKTKADNIEQKMKDLLTCIDYLEEIQLKGDDSFMVNPTREMAPLSSGQRVDLMEGMTDAALRNDMLEYSLEKNRSAQSLLAVYGFLNLTAVALIIYIYRTK